MYRIQSEHKEIQALVRGMRRNTEFAHYLYLRVADSAQARDWLASRPEPTSILGATQASADAVLWNIAFSAEGLRRLGVNEHIMASFPEEFLQGMAYRSVDNGDVGSSAPANWESHWTGRGVDVWLGYYSANSAALKDAVDALKLGLPAGIDVVAEQEAHRNFLYQTSVYIDDPATQPRPRDRHMIMEQFGFHDGITTPAIQGIWDDTEPTPDVTRVKGNGKLENGEWLPLAPGEFLLGHVDEIGEIPIAPSPELLSRNGTFMVARKLHQHVDRFRNYCREQAAEAGVSADYIAQKVIGRHRDGTSFNDPYRENNFSFRSDPHGHRCPLGSHIRRANPRDTMGYESLLVNRHRVARRAYAYGNLVPTGATEQDINPETGQGLVFLAIMSSISRQFEFVQRQWINYGNDLDQGDDRDPVVGNHLGDEKSRMVIPANAWNEPGGEPAILCRHLPRFVDTRGGEYLFIPSIRAVAALADGSFS